MDETHNLARHRALSLKASNGTRTGLGWVHQFLGTKVAAVINLWERHPNWNQHQLQELFPWQCLRMVRLGVLDELGRFQVHCTMQALGP